jgi:hypothetical protein
MKSTSRTTLLLSFWIVAFLAAAGASAFLFWRIMASNERASAVEAQIDGVTADMARKREEAKLAKTIEPSKLALTAAVLPEDGIVKFVSAFDTIKLYTSATAELQNIMPAAVIDDHYETIGAQLKFNGTWKQMFHAISYVEALPFAGHIADLTVQVVQEKKGTVWNGTLTYRAVKFRDIQQ